MKKSILKYGDVVEILTEKPDSINRYAIVSVVTENGVLVSNMNMPFSGTFGYVAFAFKDVRLIQESS